MDFKTFFLLLKLFLSISDQMKHPFGPRNGKPIKRESAHQFSWQCILGCES